MTEVRIGGNADDIAVYCLEVLNVVTESYDLRRAHKRASTQHSSLTMHIIHT